MGRKKSVKDAKNHSYDVRRTFRQHDSALMIENGTEDGTFTIRSTTGKEADKHLFYETI